jgi:hypothetical protein
LTRDVVGAQRLLNTAAATLAAGVLTDSTTEHYRAGFHNPVMFAAPLMSAAVLAASTRAALRPGAGGPLHAAVLGMSVATGFIGFGFHARNTSRRIGGWLSSGNVFYGAPVAAPLAATMAGMLGLVASRMNRGTSPHDSAMQDRPALLVAGLATLGLCGTAAEAGALHFRGAFQNPFMYAPIVLPPIAATALAGATAMRSPRAQCVARTLLRLTAWLGVAGVGFHAWGVRRRMGGWTNWRQNLLTGPPLPAPPAFSGLALAGLAALQLVEPRMQR